jgi:hypothetical protein
MTTMTEQVRAEARELDPMRVLQTLLLAIPFALGWLAGTLWTGADWAWTAIVVGFRTARGAPPERERGDRPGPQAQASRDLYGFDDSRKRGGDEW